MKLHPDRLDGLVITASGPDWIAVNGQRHTNSILIDSRSTVSPWRPACFEDLAAQDFYPLVLAHPEVVILGSGPRLRFPHPAWVAELASHRIGIETMDTAAACRTYNILAAEGRHVVAAMLLGRA